MDEQLQKLHELVGSKVVVPLIQPPKVKDEAIEHWNPAILTNNADGSRWIAVFTTPELCSAFCAQQPQYVSQVRVEARWLLYNMPPDHGILFNMGTPQQTFQWGAEGIKKYRKDFFGWE